MEFLAVDLVIQMPHQRSAVEGRVLRRSGQQRGDDEGIAVTTADAQESLWCRSYRIWRCLSDATAVGARG